MKKTHNRYGFKKVLQTLLVLFVITAAQNAHGTPHNRTLVNHSGTSAKVSVKVAGTTESEILVDVKILNTKAEKLFLIIENERGDELYRNEIERADFVTRFRLQKADNISSYSVLIRSANKSLQEKYSIKTATKLIEDVTVTKL